MSTASDGVHLQKAHDTGQAKAKAKQAKEGK